MILRYDYVAKGFNVHRLCFRSYPMTGRYPAIWTDALYEKICVDIHVVCGVNEQAHRAVLTVEATLENPKKVILNGLQYLLKKGVRYANNHRGDQEKFVKLHIQNGRTIAVFLPGTEFVAPPFQTGLELTVKNAK